MSLHITAVYTIIPGKETKGCHRYHRQSGDMGVETLYIRKEHLDDPDPPRCLLVKIEAVE